MKKMGVSIEPLEDINKVVLEGNEKKLVVYDPVVSVVSYGPRKVIQIEGEIIEEEIEEELEIPEEDIALVAEKAGVDYEAAKKALIEEKGDLAGAILKLKSGK